MLKRFSTGWAWLNWGVLLGVESTRLIAIRRCEESTGVRVERVQDISEEDARRGT